MISVHQLEGHKIGKYQIRRQIGDGGQAVVYEALYTDLDTTVAIKFLQDRIAQMPHIRERFRREARLQFKLQHPHIIRVLEIVEEDTLMGMVMDWVEGPDLEHYLTEQARGLSPKEVEELFLPILRALGYAHQKKIIHRDLKPANILLERSGQSFVPKVMDFGIAKSLEDDDQQTKTNTLLGTPQYIAPEQANSSKHVDHRADIYALGIMLYRMLAGRLPFEGRDLLQLITAHMLEDPPPIASWGPIVPPALEAVARKALAKRPEERFEHCEDFERALQAVLRGRFQEVQHLLAPPSKALFSHVSHTNLNPFVPDPSEQSLLQAPTSSPQNPFSPPDASFLQHPFIAPTGRSQDTPLPNAPTSHPYQPLSDTSFDFHLYQSPTVSVPPQELLRLTPQAHVLPTLDPIASPPSSSPSGSVAIAAHSLETPAPRNAHQEPSYPPPAQGTSSIPAQQKASEEFFPLPSGEVAIFPASSSHPAYMRQHISAPPPQGAGHWLSLSIGVLGLTALVLVALWGRPTPHKQPTQPPQRTLVTQPSSVPSPRRQEPAKRPVPTKQIPKRPVEPRTTQDVVPPRIVPSPRKTRPKAAKLLRTCSRCLYRALDLQKGSSSGLSIDAARPCSSNSIQRAIRTCYRSCARDGALFCKAFGQQKAPTALFAPPTPLSKHGILCRSTLLAKLVSRSKRRFKQKASFQNCLRAFEGKP